MFTTKLLSSLEKVFLDEEPRVTEIASNTALRGEVFSFQWAFMRDFSNGCGTQRYRLEVESPLKEHLDIFAVRSVPCEVPAYLYEKDDDYLRTAPGLFPDCLEPVRPNFILMPWQWRSVFVSVNVPKDCEAGMYPITLRLLQDETGHREPKDDGVVRAEATFTLEVVGATMPEQKLIYTQWLHNDCLATYYRVPVWSEEHWTILGNYMRDMAAHGINMVLTPIFTPPLDTEPGGERLTTQLLDITCEGDGYVFNFDKLERYLKLADESGVKYFEMSHLFTQWGAAHAPKIIATVNGEEKKIFGWDTDSVSDEYQNFLKALFRDLLPWLRERDWLDRTYFHFSDEPHIEHMEKYAAASAVARELLKDCNMIDALSEYPFYEKGLITNPIPSTYRAKKFYDQGVKTRWTYYCCDQAQDVGNRFMAMPSYRNRVLGCQMYKFGVEGFLHWGYNFWNSQFSQCPIDPYAVTDAHNAFQSGDAFSVYPGADGKPVSSLRYVVFNEALQDMRAMQLLETMIPREEIIKKLDDINRGELNFFSYAHYAKALLQMRLWVNKKIKECIEQ